MWTWMHALVFTYVGGHALAAALVAAVLLYSLQDLVPAVLLAAGVYYLYSL